MTLLAIDIGNSALKAGIFANRELQETHRLAYADRSPEDIGQALRARVVDQAISHVGISSVVPQVEAVVRRAFEDQPVFRVSHKSPLPITLAYADPSRLGADRIALVVGAYEAARTHYGARGAVVAIDAGTATTLNVVDAAARFIGGLIWAGPDLVERALHEGTAQLPAVTTGGAIAVIPNDPVTAIRSAATFGFIEGVRGMLRRIEDELGEQPFVIATGGRGSLLKEALDRVDTFEPHLVLQGIRIVMERSIGS